MADSSLFNNEHRIIESRPPLGEELLPPVEQPSARFIIQLFVVPLLIVMLIVAVFLSIRWLVRSTEMGPEQLIQGIETGPNVARWQRAKDLADLLHDKQYPEFRQSHEGAAHLARMLDREIDQADMEALNIEFRGYLARALAEMDVQEGTDILLKAAKTNRDPREQRGARRCDPGPRDPGRQFATAQSAASNFESGCGAYVASFCRGRRSAHSISGGLCLRSNRHAGRDRAARSYGK